MHLKRKSSQLFWILLTLAIIAAGSTYDYRNPVACSYHKIITLYA